MMVKPQSQGNKKLYQTQNGITVQYEVVGDQATTGWHSYKVGSGDVLEILVEDTGNDHSPQYSIKEDRVRFAGMDFTRSQVTIDPMGNFNIPLVGEIHAADLPVSGIEQEIKRKLETYLIDPKIFVKIIVYSSYSISIMGEVKKPGRYEIKKPITLSEALALGGGITRDGTMSKMFVGRRGKKSRRMNITKVWAFGMLDNEIVLERDDVVFAAPKFWVTLPELEQISNIISNISNVLFQWK